MITPERRETNEKVISGMLLIIILLALIFPVWHWRMTGLNLNWVTIHF